MINDTLVAAAQYMDKHGKACGQYESSDGRVCMLGAIHMVLYGTSGAQPSWAIVQEEFVASRRIEGYAASTKIGEEKLCSSVPAINDYVLDTKEETVKFMMEAAEWEPKQ
jgi:hypothetical protein